MTDKDFQGRCGRCWWKYFGDRPNQSTRKRCPEEPVSPGGAVAMVEQAHGAKLEIRQSWEPVSVSSQVFVAGRTAKLETTHWLTLQLVRCCNGNHWIPGFSAESGMSQLPSSVLNNMIGHHVLTDGHCQTDSVTLTQWADWDSAESIIASTEGCQHSGPSPLVFTVASFLKNRNVLSPWVQSVLCGLPVT